MPPLEIGDTGDAGNIEAVSKIFSKKDGLVTPGASRQHTGAGLPGFSPTSKAKGSPVSPESRPGTSAGGVPTKRQDEAEEPKQKQSEEPQGH
jgi:hypothetical protein